MSKSDLERPNLTNGQKNPKYVDVLDEDKPIKEQNYACISFLSPENILKQKELFFFNEFINSYDKDTSIKKFMGFLGWMGDQYGIELEDLTKDFNDFLKKEHDNLFHTTLSDEYKNFLDMNEEKLQQEFDNQNNYQTSVRGLKVRGNFNTIEEAKMRAEVLREADPFNQIYVGEVGKWMPWEPVYYKTGEVEYLEPELNQLMQEKNKNEQAAKRQFEDRVKEAKRKAIENNIKTAEDSGNKLTQNIDNEGNLVGVGSDMTTQVKNLMNNEEITSADVRKELFEGEDIRTKAFDKEHEDPMIEKFKELNKK
jgi:hypothetical protein